MTANKKCLALLLALVLVLCLMPAVSLAEGPANYTMDFTELGATWGGLVNVNLSENNATGTNWEWVASSKTLTLNNLNFVTTAKIALKVPGGTTIVLIGNSTVASQCNNANESSSGLFASGNLTIIGSGSLTATAGTVKGNNESYGIACTGAAVISGGATVTANAGSSAALNSVGMKVSGQDAALTVSNATLNANGGAAALGDSYGIYVTADRLEVQPGGVVNANGGVSNNRSSGVYSAANNSGEQIAVSGGTLIARGGTATGTSFGIGLHNAARVSVSGGTLSATGGTATGTSYGIYSRNGAAQIAVSGGSITAQSGAASTQSAFDRAPQLSGSPSYKWRLSTTGALTESTVQKYIWKGADSLVYIEHSTVTPAAVPADDSIFTSPTEAETVAVSPGSRAKLSVATSQPTGLQWYIDRGDGKGFVQLSGATGASYTSSAVSAANNGYRYFCVADNGDRSHVFTLSVVAGVPDTGDAPVWFAALLLAGAALGLALKKRRA